MSRHLVPFVLGAVVVAACSAFGSEATDATPKDDAGAAHDASSPREEAGVSDGQASADGGGAEVAAACAGVDPTTDFCSPSCGAGLCGTCLDIKGLFAAPSGYYKVAGTGIDPLEVYCDMTTAGGGWILIGRSAGDHGEMFGWNEQTGAVKDDANPYSLDVSRLRVAAADMLFGVRADGKTWNTSAGVYTLTLSSYPSFGKPETASETFYTSGELATVYGPCPNAGAVGGFGPYIGYTIATNVFFFHDVDATGLHGLTAGGWHEVSNTADCEHQGGLGEGEPGMIFVREARHH